MYLKIYAYTVWNQLARPMRNADDYDNDDYVRPTGLPSAQTYAVLPYTFSIRNSMWCAWRWKLIPFLSYDVTSTWEQALAGNYKFNATYQSLKFDVFPWVRFSILPQRSYVPPLLSSVGLPLCSFTGDQQGVDCLRVEVLRLNWHLQQLQVIWAGFWRSASSVLKAWA